MTGEVILPRLDEAMLAGKIAGWLKKEGDWVVKGEGIVEIESEKATMEIQAETTGILGKIIVKEGDEVPVGTIIAFILQPGEKIPEVVESLAITGKTSIEIPKVVAVEGLQNKVPKAHMETKEIIISPVARRIAQENNIDISWIKGTGPDGRIVREDVLRAIEEKQAVVAQPIQVEPVMEKPVIDVPIITEEQISPLSTKRKVIARRMTESFQTPHFYLTVESEAQELVKTHKQLIPLVENKSGIKPTITDLIIKITAKALEDNPSMNCAYSDGSVKLFKRIDIGLVISIEDGLVVSVIRDANKKSISEIAQTRIELVQKAREGRLSLEEMKGSTFTISNLGMYGIDQFSAILQSPEAAILAVGRIAERAVVRDGLIVIRLMMNITLSIDHRVLDGVIGAEFLQSLKNYLENPTLLLLKY